MKAALHLIRSARADFAQHQEPESVHWAVDLLCGGSLVAAMLFGLVSI